MQASVCMTDERKTLGLQRTVWPYLRRTESTIKPSHPTTGMLF